MDQPQPPTLYRTDPLLIAAVLAILAVWSCTPAEEVPCHDMKTTEATMPRATRTMGDPRWTNLAMKARTTGVPEHIIHGLADYICYGHPVGDFLRAVLSNDLAEACGRADMENRHRLFEIVQFIWNDCPRQAWGSPGAVKCWVEKHKGDTGQADADD